jgi:hypothetical protein
MRPTPSANLLGSVDRGHLTGRPLLTILVYQKPPTRLKAQMFAHNRHGPETTED